MSLHYPVGELFTKEDFQNRVKKTQKAMQKENFDVVITYADYYRNRNVYYLTNFRPFEASHYHWPGQLGCCLCLVPKEGDPTLFAAHSGFDEARDLVWMDEKHVKPTSEFKSSMKDFVSKEKPKKLGLTDWPIFPTQIYKDVIEDVFGGVAVEWTHLLDKIRMVKEDKEVKYMIESGRVNDLGTMKVLENLKEGMTEEEASLIGRMAMYKEGATNIGACWMQFGPKYSSFMSKRPYTNVRLKKGWLVRLDYGCKVKDYYSDNGLAVGFGKISDDAKDILETLHESIEIGWKTVRPGTKTKDLWEKMNKPFVEKGYKTGEPFGHSVGIDFEDELPCMGKNSEGAYEKNMCVSIACHINHVEGVGGGKIEETVCIKETGPLLITHCSEMPWYW